MVSFNKVLVVGNLTKDPELRYTPQGLAVTTLRIAVNTTFKDKAGESRKDTCFINVIVWAKMAEVCNQYLEKGKAVFVEGRLQSRSWQGSDGKTRNTIEITASNIQFMPSGGRPDSKGDEQEIEAGEGIKSDSQELGEVV